MARPTPTSADLAIAVAAASFTAAGQATPWQSFTGAFNLAIAGVFAGSVILELSFDGGTTAIPATNLGAPVSFSAPATEVLRNPEPGVLFRLRCTARSSGTIEARLSQ